MTSPFPAWHPWFGEVAIVLRHRASLASTPVALTALAALLGVVVLVFGWAHLEGVVLASASNRILAIPANWPLPSAVAIAAIAYLLVNIRLQALSSRLNDGWWAAMPIDPRSRTVALWLVAGTVAMTLLLALLLIAGALIALGARTEIGIAVAIIVASIVSGTFAALIATFRKPRSRHQAMVRIGTRQPLFGIAWLDDRHLPHLSDWQRRSALLRWRTHSSAMPVLAVLLLLPAGTSPQTLVGMLLFALSAVWLGVVLHASVQMAAAASDLLQSTQASARRKFRAALRYPAFACVCASCIALPVALTAGSLAIAVAWLTLVVLLTISALPLAWRLLRDLRNAQ